MRSSRPARAALWRARLILVLPLLVVLGGDVTRRWERFQQFAGLDWLSYSASALEGAIVWGVLLLAASRQRGRVRWWARGAFLFFFVVAVGGQVYFFEQYNAYLNVDASIFAANFVESVVEQLWADAGNYATAKLPVAMAAVVMLALALHWLRAPRRVARAASRLTPVVVLAALLVPTRHGSLQAAPPDMLYMHAMGGMLRTQLGLTKHSGKLRPRVRHSMPLPELSRADQPQRNIVFVILESVRRDAVCVDYDPDCQLTPSTNRAFPARIGLNQMRALDSSTAISMAVLWSGVGPHESREVLHEWPLLFDYARAAGYSTGYWTSQSMLFGNMRLFVQNLGVDSMFSATDVEPTSHVDMGCHEGLFADRVEVEVGQLREPFFVTIQLSNGHYPYLIDPELPQPFQPASTSKAEDDTKEFRNHYQNAVVQEDGHLARMLTAFRAAPSGERTVFVVTSDHAEAFREHHQMGHTLSVYDEEIHIPAWVDAPVGTLTSDEQQALEDARREYTLHPDLSATVIDLIGVWDDPAIARYRQKIVGRSLLRPRAESPAVPLTNCSGVWSCAFENWGYLKGSHKLEARPWDSRYHCFDLSVDPEEKNDLGPAACGDLAARATKVFGRLPGKGRD